VTEPFDALAQLASVDATLITLERSRAFLPARVALAELDSLVAGIDRALGLLDDERQGLDAALATLERDVERMSQREAELSAKMAVATGAGRELNAMHQEVTHLASKRDALETQELELLQALEPFDAAQAPLVQERQQAEATRPGLIGTLQREETALKGEILEAQARQQDVQSRIDPALLERYARIAKGSQGVGASLLEHGHCSGCHLGLAAVELDRLKKMPLEDIALCEQCGRLLLRPEQLS